MKPKIDLQTQIINAENFAKKWYQYTDEKSGKDSFYNDFFAIFGIDRFYDAAFEWRVKDKQSSSTKFADLFWEGVFLAEHKSAGVDLAQAKLQAEGYLATIQAHTPDLMPRFYAVSDFANFHLFEVNNPDFALKFPLLDLPKHIANGAFAFMHGHESRLREDEERANTKAAEQIGKLYKAFKARQVYKDHELRLMITRLLFLLFADDSAVWQTRNGLFFDLIEQHTSETGADLGSRLHELFEVLNTPENERDCLPIYHAFDYVNGGLFAEPLRTFRFDAELRELLLDCCAINWKQISPEIFGTLFQSVMEKTRDDTGNIIKDERREKGAHYTEKANIEKVIKSLFLDALQAELQAVRSAKKNTKQDKERRIQAFADFHRKLANLTFLDPACGCGNFLIIAYEALRKLEDDLFEAMYFDGKPHTAQIGFSETIANVWVTPTQFHGIEIDGFATMIAKVAMWLKEHQCNLETKRRFGGAIACETLPLKDEAHIINGNSLELDWVEADYILGNPPFIGMAWRNAEQQADCDRVFPKESKFGKMDYVACWYVKAARQMLQRPQTRTAFVSTNSICQGEQAGILWKWLFDQQFYIRFAHRTFQWTSQASGKAAVHCVIVGFELPTSGQKPTEVCLFDYPDIKGEPILLKVANINQYLAAGASVIIDSRAKVPAGMTKMTKGSQPTDGGNWILSPSERAELVKKYPDLTACIKPFIGADELINGGERYCLWFADTSLSDLAKFDKYPEIKARKEAVKALRQKSPTKSVQEQAATPYLFTQNRQPKTNFLAMPRVSSETRKYIPIDFLTPDNIVSDRIGYIANATEYEFGVLISAIHMAWMRTVAGRLESRYSYDANVYHSFPFPNADERQRQQIITLAQAVLSERKNAKAQDPNVTLAMLYNPDTMPQGLRKAHQALDKAVDKLYRSTPFSTESERVGWLFDLYRDKNR